MEKLLPFIPKLPIIYRILELQEILKLFCLIHSLYAWKLKLGVIGELLE